MEDLNSSMNSSVIIVTGLAEVDDDIDQIQKDLRRAERGIYLSSSIDYDPRDSVMIGSPIFQKKKKDRSVLDVLKTEESFRGQISHLERENFNLNSDVLRLTKDNKKLVEEIFEKNLTIREMGKKDNTGIQSSDLKKVKDENSRLGQEVQTLESTIISLQMQLKKQEDVQNGGNNERIRQYLAGIQAEKERLAKSEEFMKAQIGSLKLEIAKLRETQKKALELTETQQVQFEKQKNEDSLKIRIMKNKYETNFEEVKRDYENSYQKMKEELRMLQMGRSVDLEGGSTEKGVERSDKVSVVDNNEINVL